MVTLRLVDGLAECLAVNAARSTVCRFALSGESFLVLDVARRRREV